MALILQMLAAPALAREPLTRASVMKAVAELERLAKKQVDEKRVLGLAVAVVFKDQVVAARGFGLREAGSPEKVDADTVFQLASLSKPLAATVVAALVGEGKVSWDTKIADIDPGFAMHDPWVTREITIRDLFAHRSGLPDHAGDLLEDMGYDRGQVLYRLRYQRPATSFRSRYAYTNFGLTEAAVAAARAGGMGWEEACQKKLYEPLAMNSASSRYADFLARTNKAPGHVLVDGQWVAQYRRNADAQSPAGGASASVSDVAQWVRLQIAGGRFDGREVVDKTALAETHRPVMLTQFSPIDGLPGFYGLGWNVSYDSEGRLRLGHSGAFAAGAATHVSVIPKEELGVVVLTNSYPVGVAEGLSAAFIDCALSGKPSRDWLALFRAVFASPAAVGIEKGYDYSKPPAEPAPALKNGSYLGRYTNELYGDIEIAEVDGALALRQGPLRQPYRMKHYDRDTFIYQTDGENAAGPSGVIFRIGPDGRASSVLIEHLNHDGQGVFERKD